MRILAVSDIESKSLYDFFSPDKVEGVELIIGCGDLREEYLEFLVTMMNVPLLYIHGNHDDHFKREPEGCVCIDDKFYEYKGIRFVGLGGSFRYRDGQYMYTEREMKRRIFRLWPKIHLKLFMHGHIHRNYGARIPQKSEHDGTLVINASDYCIFDIDL